MDPSVQPTPTAIRRASLKTEAEHQAILGGFSIFLRPQPVLTPISLSKDFQVRLTLIKFADKIKAGRISNRSWARPK